MFNWNAPKPSITAAIKKYGLQMKLTQGISADADGRAVTAYGIWDSNSKSDIAQGGTKVTASRRQVYIAATLKTDPAVGDTITSNGQQYSIEEVEAYRPASVVLAYRVVVV